ncbi:MAG: CHAT domain-containing protein [Bacteroidetes bacterium]|nr:CHAT domain-containing protein [Bacteroidota bacterium]
MDYFDKDQSKLSDNLNNANLIHIASHNMVNYMKPLKSSFTIKGNPDIANITFLDILHSRKKYHFAYINTCESGTGPVNIGEGFLSMGLAFMISGTKSTIQHLWKAPDRAASTISHNFYKYLNKTESCNALRNAKRKYLENTRPGLDHPHYWSGVLYYGQNWRINKIKWPVYIAISLGLFIFLYFVFRKRNFCSNFLTSFS